MPGGATTTPRRAGRTSERFTQLVEAATRVLVSRSYRRATMADVAREMGVSPGTLYLYVESKEALFHLLITKALAEPRAAGSGAAGSGAAAGALPLATPPPGSTLEFVRARLTQASFLPSLEAALSGPPPDGAAAEFRTIVAELYDKAALYRTAINLIESSAKDWPDMYELFYRGFLRGLVDALARYLNDRMDRGLLRRVTAPSVAARLLLETVAWTAIHRHRDTFPVEFGDDEARATTIDILANSLIPH